MKTLFTLFILISSFVNGQKIEHLDTLKLSDLPDLKTLKNRVDVSVLIMEDGSTITKESDLVVGSLSNPNNVKYYAYTGSSTEFTYLFVDKYSIMGAMAGVGFNSKNTGDEIVVEEIILFKTGKRTQIVVNFTRKDGANIAMGKYGNIRDLEKAILQGEIINPNRAMNRDEAVKKLKESKDLLDLEIISQDEYDKIKETLTPIIKSE